MGALGCRWGAGLVDELDYVAEARNAARFNEEVHGWDPNGWDPSGWDPSGSDPNGWDPNRWNPNWRDTRGMEMCVRYVSVWEG